MNRERERSRGRERSRERSRDRGREEARGGGQREGHEAAAQAQRAGMQGRGGGKEGGGGQDGRELLMQLLLLASELWPDKVGPLTAHGRSARPLPRANVRSGLAWRVRSLGRYDPQQ